ncbi:MAG: PAS domain-containing protein [Rickettsiales bacterium]|nr:PAS domain-containing protein [Rickettsiales bacterium]
MAFEESGRERRISLILLQYWNKQRGDNDVPWETDMFPEDLSTIWPHCFVLHCHRSGDLQKFEYQYLGSEITNPYKSGVLDPQNHVMVSPQPNRLSHSYEHVLESKEPLLDEGECLGLSGELIKFRQCMMPLLSKEEGVEAIIGGAWYKIFEGA